MKESKPIPYLHKRSDSDERAFPPVPNLCRNRKNVSHRTSNIFSILKIACEGLGRVLAARGNTTKFVK